MTCPSRTSLRTTHKEVRWRLNSTAEQRGSTGRKCSWFYFHLEKPFFPSSVGVGDSHHGPLRRLSECTRTGDLHRVGHV